MWPKLVAFYPWGFVIENPTQGQKKEPATKQEEDHNNEEISLVGSTSVDSVVFTSRMQNQKQPCHGKNQKETLSLFPGIMVPRLKKEPVKRENQYNKEISESINTFVRWFPDSRIMESGYLDLFSDIIENEIKEASLSDEAKVPLKRKTPEVEENREVSVDLTPPLVYQSNKKKPRTDVEVSTKLTLFDETWPTENREPYVKELSKADIKEREVTCKIAAMKNYRPGEEEEEKRKGLSTILELYLDQWIIKKKLTRSDLNHLSRLLLKTSLVEKHALPLMEDTVVKDVVKEKGLTVTVCDQDTDSLHSLVFKKWHSCQSYILNGKWVQDFVIRRNLKEGDEIGMFWDQNCSRFNFCVLNRAPVIQPTAAKGTPRSGRK